MKMTNKLTSKVIQIIQGEYVTILCEDGSVWTQLATKCGWYCILEAHKEPEAKQEQKLPEVGDVYKDKLNGLTATVTSREYTYQNSQGFTEKQTESCFFDRFEELPDQDHISQAGKERTLEFNKDDGFKKNQTDKVQEDLTDAADIDVASIKLTKEMQEASKEFYPEEDDRSIEVQGALKGLKAHMKEDLWRNNQYLNEQDCYDLFYSHVENLVNALEPKDFFMPTNVDLAYKGKESNDYTVDVRTLKKSLKD